MNENQTTTEEFSYDVMAYPSLTLAQTHPDRLAAAAKLYGMNPAPADKCRVLELGCGTGTNVNWLAANLPESEFVGVDLAQVHIIEAKRHAAELGLKNVSFFQQDVMEITEKTFGKFDYIIAHGLFSWVPDFVREKVLSVYDELLNPQGVGFISYNVYPGCYRRQMVGEMMQFYTARFENPVEKVEKGVEFIRFLTDSTVSNNTYHELLKHELEGFSRRPIENIYHDDLSDINQPFYFTEFIAEAEKHNLKFLSECDYLPTQRNNIPPDIADVFDSYSRNTIEYEQYADFLDCRRFRQTLLCKKDINLKDEINPLDLREYYVSSQMKPTAPTIDLNPNSFKEFIGKRGDSVRIAHVLTKVVLSLLVNFGSHPVKFDDLIEKGSEILQSQGFISEEPEKDVEITASLLLQLYSPSAVGFHTVQSNLLDYISEKPIVDRFALWHSAHSDLAVNYYGIGLNVEDDFTRMLLQLLDGTRKREDLIKDITEIVNSNEKIEDEESFFAELSEKLDRDLFILAKMGFLIG